MNKIPFQEQYLLPVERQQQRQGQEQEQQQNQVKEEGKRMKCLSVRQPWANMIVEGKKTIELRNWLTNYRGELLIHASLFKTPGLDDKSFTRGKIIGKVNLSDIKTYNSVAEFRNDSDKHQSKLCQIQTQTEELELPYRHGFLLKDAEKFDKPIELVGKGKAGSLFDIGIDIQGIAISNNR